MEDKKTVMITEGRVFQEMEEIPRIFSVKKVHDARKEGISRI